MNKLFLYSDMYLKYLTRLYSQAKNPSRITRKIYLEIYDNCFKKVQLIAEYETDGPFWTSLCL